MAFMEPDYFHGTMFLIETDNGERTLIPDDLMGGISKRLARKLAAGETVEIHPDGSGSRYLAVYVECGKPVAIERFTGYFCRLSAPGYMDRTEWDGPFPTLEEARDHIAEFHDACADCGNDLADEGNTCAACAGDADTDEDAS